MRIMQLWLILTACTLGAGCATQPPVEHVQLFRQAFTNLHAASQPLFDDLAAAERRQGQEVAVTKAQATATPAADVSVVRVKGPALPASPLSRVDGKPGEAPAASPPPDGQPPLSFARCVDGSPNWQRAGTSIGFIRGFCVEDSPYFSDLTDPPATQAFRTGLAVLAKYSELLVMLAEGTNIEAARAHIQSLGMSVAAGIALVPGAQASGALLMPVLAALGPIIDAAAKAGNAAELKRLVTEAAPRFSTLVFALQASSKEIFTTLTESSVAQATPLNLKQNPELGPVLVSRIDGYRRALSDFNVMLTELDGAHKQLLEALRRDEQPTLAAVANRAERLNTQADALRHTFMILRRGKP